MKICRHHFLLVLPSPKNCMTSLTVRNRRKSLRGPKVGYCSQIPYLCISLIFLLFSCLLYTSDGTSFEVKDPKRLELEILPKYFRHARFQSFVRQLNFYSFKKISKERNSWIYSHDFFQRGNINATLLFVLLFFFSLV